MMEDKAEAVDVINRVWKFFTSVKLTIVLLLSLAATSIVGTLIPQNESPADYFRAYGQFFYRLFDSLDLFDMYHSWWFQILMLMLTINVVVCSMDRLPGIWKIVRIKSPKFSRDRFKAAADREEFTVDASTDRLKARCTELVSKSFSYHTLEDQKKGFALFGEKGRWTRLGVYTVHLSVILLLTGGLIGSIFGFEGYVNIPEGERVDSVRLRKSNMIRPLDFQIQCDDFDVRFYDTHNRMPKEFRSTLTIIENGRAVLTRDIIVNDPLRYRGINIYQSSYGKLPDEAPSSIQISKEHIELNIVSSSSGMVYKETTAIGNTLEMPEGMGRLVIMAFDPDASFRGQKIGEALTAVLTPKDGPPAEILLPLRFSNFDRMRGGEQVISVVIPEAAADDGGSQRTDRFFTGLQVTKDPGVWVVYSGFTLMIIGCIITFFMSHQRIFIEVVKSGNNSRVIVTGAANKNKLGMRKRIQSIARRLKHED